MLRVRFKTDEGDYRPIKWPVKYPYWCTGYGGNDCSCYIVVAYATNLDYVYENWPEAYDIDEEEVTKIEFTDRFQKPDWYEEA